MGIDIHYWYDHGLEFTTISDLHFHLERYLEAKITIFYTADSSDKWCQVYSQDYDKWTKIYPEHKEYFRYTSLKSISEKNETEYYLEIIDEHGKLTDFENQNIDELIRTKDIHLFLSSTEEDIEVSIYHKTLRISGWLLSFPGRMPSFIETIENPEEGFTEEYLKILYRINKFVKAFNSQNMLLIGDTQSLNWENMDEDLQYEGYSISDVLKKYTAQGIKIISETMILNKEISPYNSGKDLDSTYFEFDKNHVYYFNLRKLFSYLIPCEFREEPQESEEYYYKSKPKPPVVYLEASITTTENKSGETKKEVIRIEQNQEGYKDYTVTKKSYDMNDELISSEEVDYSSQQCANILEQTKCLDYGTLVKKYFKYTKGNGKIYFLNYHNIDFSIVVSLWCSIHEEKAPKEFVDFIKDLFVPKKKSYQRVIEVDGYSIDWIPTEKFPKGSN